MATEISGKDRPASAAAAHARTAHRHGAADNRRERRRGNRTSIPGTIDAEPTNAATGAGYFFSAAASTFLQAGVSLSFDLARQAMILPPPGVVPLQTFS